MSKHMCLISIPSENEQNPSATNIFVIDGVPVTYSVGHAEEQDGGVKVNITSSLGHVKHIILQEIAEKVCIHPIDSEQPEFIKEKIEERFKQIKSISKENNETIGYLVLLSNESLCTAFYHAFRLMDSDGKPTPDIEPATLASLGLSITPPFHDIETRNLN